MVATTAATVAVVLGPLVAIMEGAPEVLGVITLAEEARVQRADTMAEAQRAARAAPAATELMATTRNRATASKSITASRPTNSPSTLNPSTLRQPRPTALIALWGISTIWGYLIAGAIGAAVGAVIMAIVVIVWIVANWPTH